MLALFLLLQISAELAFPPAILNLQRVLAESVEGKAVVAKFEAPAWCTSRLFPRSVPKSNRLS